MKKNNLSVGAHIEVDSSQGVFTGSVIPSFEQDVLAIKLDSGYNVGIAVGNVKNIKKLGAGKKVGKGKVASAVKKNPELPLISILHTGGTIASRVDYRTGAVFSAFTPEDLLTMFPELGDIANFESRLVANMWSDDLRFGHISRIAKEVEKEVKKGVRGVIIGMGTDNMAVASAALSFALEGCPVPVLFVGAQRSSDRGSSDAAMNLICAANFILKSDFAGVAICMHHSSGDERCAILPGTKTRKLHTSRRDAFRAVNTTPIALVDYNSKKVEFLHKDYPRAGKGKLVVKPDFEDKVGLLKIHINMDPAIFDFFRKQKYKGLVIEGTGLGHTPGHVPSPEAAVYKKVFPAISGFVKQGGVAVMASQCLFGRVHMHVYDKGTDLLKLGVVPGEDMLAETAFVKLAWLLGNYKKRADVERLLRENLRGEITSRTMIQEADLPAINEN